MHDFKASLLRIRRYITTNSLIVSVVVFLLLLLGLVITVDQATRQQDTRSQAAGQIKNCTIAANQIAQDSEEKKLLQLINQYRKEKNIPQLKQHNSLNRSAAWMSNNMATKDYFNHKDLSNRFQGKRAVDCGYPGRENQVRENIHAATSSDKAQAAFNAWKQSKIHNETMLDRTMVYAGIGRRHDPKSSLGWYWVLDVAQKPENENKNPPPTDPGDDDTGEEDECVDEQAVVETESSGANGGLPGGAGKNNNKKTNQKKSTKKQTQKKKNTKKKKNTNNKKKKNNNNGKQEKTTDPEPIPCDEPDEEQDENEEEEDIIPTPRPKTPGIFFDVALPGIGGTGNDEPVHDTRDVSIQLFNASGSAIFNKTLEAGFDGEVFYAFVDDTELQSGNYQIRVKLPNTLRKTLTPEFQTIDLTEQTTIRIEDLIIGDFDNNNVLNITDYNIFRSCVDAGFLDDEEEEFIEEEDEFFDEEEDFEDDEFLDEEEEFEDDEEFFDDEEEFVDEDEEDFEEDEESGASSTQSSRVQQAACVNHDATDINDDGAVDMIDYNFLLEGFTSVRGN